MESIGSCWHRQVGYVAGTINRLLSQQNPGEIENLVRHLVCVDVETGEILWQRDVNVSLPEDPYSAIGVTAHRLQLRRLGISINID